MWGLFLLSTVFVFLQLSVCVSVSVSAAELSAVLLLYLTKSCAKLRHHFLPWLYVESFVWWLSWCYFLQSLARGLPCACSHGYQHPLRLILGGSFE